MVPFATALWLSFAVLAGAQACDPPSGVRRPLIGAIRWDAWHGRRGQPGQVVEKTLGPAKYHDRLPFFARIVGPDKVEICGDSQDVLDREIAYARQAGLDYWAFVTYEPDSPMSLGLEHYLNSTKKQGLRFCLITEQGKWGGPATYREKISRFVRLLGESSYLKVLGDRPLLYLGFIEEAKTSRDWGGLAGFKKAIDVFRDEIVRAGLGQPYIVILAFDPGSAHRQAQALGADAISSYALPGGTEEGAPFARSMQRARQFWESCKATGAQVVPIVSFGWDPRPRVDNPVPWFKYPHANHYEAASPEELAGHLEEALHWTVTNHECARANTILIYAWNENDEGGYLVPTLGPAGAPDARRVQAIGRMLRHWTPPGQRQNKD